MAQQYDQPDPLTPTPPQPDGRVEPRPAGVPAHSHEGTDVNIRPLVVTGVGLVVFLVLTCIGLALLFNFYDWFEVRSQKNESALVGIKRPEPAVKIQGVPGYSTQVPAKDMEEFRRRNDAAIGTYSTAENGVARIPVARAIDLALERNLFATAAPTTAPATGGPAATRPAGAVSRQGPAARPEGGESGPTKTPSAPAGAQPTPAGRPPSK